MTEETTTTEVATTEPETTDVTAAAATSPTEPQADQETSVASEQPEAQPEQEAKTTDDAKPAESAKAVSEDQPADRIVPEVSDYVLPEGMPDVLAQFAKDADMTQEQLDKTLDQYGRITEGAEQFRKAELFKNGQAHTESWGKQKDYNLSLVRRALSQNDPDGKLKNMLEESGYGNHPAVLDFFLTIGNSMKEGGFLKGANNTQSKSGLSAAQSMFGANHPSNN